MVFSVNAPPYPSGHIFSVIGYTKDSNGNVNGIVANDPFMNLAKYLNNEANVYASDGPNGGKGAIYDLKKTYAKSRINYSWLVETL